MEDLTTHNIRCKNTKIAEIIWAIYILVSPYNYIGGKGKSLIRRFFSANNLDIHDELKRTQRGNGDITEWWLWFLGCFEQAAVAMTTFFKKSGDG